MKAVIPAAGLGTRCLPATKSMPKEMLPVVDRPVIQYVVEEAVASGCEDILIVTGRGKRSIEDHFDKSFELEHHLERSGKAEELERVRAISDLARVHYVRQPEPRGLGDAILCAEQFVGTDPFAVLLGDDIMRAPVYPTQRLLESFRQTGSPAISVMQVEEEEVSRYGVIDGREVEPGRYSVQDMIEKPSPGQAPTRMASIGRYVFEPSIFQALGETSPGKGDELQLTDAIARLAADTELFAVAYDGERLDVGSIEGFLEANLRLGLEHEAIGPRLRRLAEQLTAGDGKD